MEELIKKNPVEPLRKAVVGMLPKNKLRGQRLRRALGPGPEHVREPQLRDAAAGSYVSRAARRRPPRDVPPVRGAAKARLSSVRASGA